ncbi:hypothetical protein HDU85_006877 [Gaertneriomyces sp. JEL0708]|nr:hypothetical protein HDU85_006877 [Gaertneriomyces sp. JEL0708]
MLGQRTRSKVVSQLLTCVIAYIALLYFGSTLLYPSPLHQPLHHSVPQSAYEGPKWRSEQTVDAVELLSNAWLRLESHTVRLENKQSANQSSAPPFSDRLITDWLWIDCVDHVNVLMHSRANNRFGVFRQRKYGIDGSTLAVIGGHVNQSFNQTTQSITQESPLDCAQREMYEELGYVSPQWIEFGTYRVNANRGEGMFSMYLALDSYKQSSEESDDDQELESQKLVWLDREQLIDRLMDGSFKEAKWSATVAMSLVWMMKHNSKAGIK